MWVRSFSGWENVRAKQFHACDNSEIATKIETDLGKARIYVNTAGVQRNQAKSTHTSEYTKSNKNVAQGMGSELTQKQLS